MTADQEAWAAMARCLELQLQRPDLTDGTAECIARVIDNARQLAGLHDLGERAGDQGAIARALREKDVLRGRSAPRWRTLPEHVKQRRGLEALGNERLTARELADRIRARADGGFEPYTSHAYALLERMRHAGEVDRSRAELINGRPVWRYRRRAELEGPIADLQRMLDEDGER